MLAILIYDIFYVGANKPGAASNVGRREFESDAISVNLFES